MHTSKDSMWREIWKILQNFWRTKQGQRKTIHLSSSSSTRGGKKNSSTPPVTSPIAAVPGAAPLAIVLGAAPPTSLPHRFSTGSRPPRPSPDCARFHPKPATIIPVRASWAGSLTSAAGKRAWSSAAVVSATLVRPVSSRPTLDFLSLRSQWG